MMFKTVADWIVNNIFCYGRYCSIYELLRHNEQREASIAVKFFHNNYRQISYQISPRIAGLGYITTVRYNKALAIKTIKQQTYY